MAVVVVVAAAALVIDDDDDDDDEDDGAKYIPAWSSHLFIIAVVVYGAQVGAGDDRRAAERYSH